MNKDEGAKSEKKDYEEELVARLDRWRQGEQAPPIKIDARLHDRCNLKCIYCSSPHEEETNSEERLTVEDWIRVVEEAAKIGVRHWNFEGACEPILQPQLAMKVMKKVKELGLYGHITTNGTLWTENQLRELIDCGWNEMSFSLDALSETHDFFTRVNNSYKRTVKKIKELNRLKRERRSKKPLLNVNTVLTSKNYEELPAIIDFCQNNGINFLFVDPVFPTTEQAKEISLKPNKELRAVIERSRRKIKATKLESNLTGNHNNLEADMIDKIGEMEPVVKKEASRYQGQSQFMSVRCYKPWYNLRINHKGKVGYCSGPDNPLFASLDGEDSLAEIWYGARFQKIREQVRQKQVEYCDNCPASFVTMRKRRRDLLAGRT